MNTDTIKNRNEIPAEYKWDLEKMYASDDLVLEDLNKGIAHAEELDAMKGHLADSAGNLHKAVTLYLDGLRLIEKAITYAHMRHDEDNSNSVYTELNDKSMSFAAKFSALVSFFTPELLESEKSVIEGYIDSKQELEEFRFLLMEIMDKKEHTLIKDQEHILASLSEVLDAPDEIFSALNDVDLEFGQIEDENGKIVALTHGNFNKMLESDDREVRKNAYYTFYERYRDHNNTISTAYNYNVKKTAIVSRLRSYGSSLEAALSSDKIPVSVYDNLLEAVHKYLPAMHKYYKVRKRVLGIDDMRMYDVHKPLVNPAGLNFTFEEAVDLCIMALEPMGEEYTSILKKGLLEEKWADVYENKSKTSGAYSFGSYDSYPYMLLNFHGDLRDVFTIIHESGHSMHSYYTRRNQPYVYGSHSIFTAEVASTVNETLLIRYLLEHCESEEMKIYLINFYIDEFKSTLIRQTMFAEFEKWAHETVENGGALTAELMNTKYDELNTAYFGDAFGQDDMIKYEWSRIPHFYRDFYVYQYATGYSAANAIANRILTEGKPAVDDYMKFLASGDSDYPIELLKIAGVDMSSTEPVESALSTLSEMIDELDELMK